MRDAHRSEAQGRVSGRSCFRGVANNIIGLGVLRLLTI